MVDAKSRKTLDSMQPLGNFNNSDIAVKPNKLEYTGKFGAISRGDLKSGFNNISTEISAMAICLICDEKGHKTYMSPYSHMRKISYFPCNKFIKMTPLERQQILERKGLCRQCLSPGVLEGHQKCPEFYKCKHPSHSSDEEGFHVLVCDRHKKTSENIELLNKFKENVIQKFSDDLPTFSKKITMHSQARYAGVTLNDGMVKGHGIFMLQTINIQGNLFNVFYDSGCGDLVCKKSAIDTLMSLGKASQEFPGSITISGVGDNKTIRNDGVYKVCLCVVVRKPS